jgi:hypothetical protein
MKMKAPKSIFWAFIIIFALILPVGSFAQTEAAPPISQPLVREGTFAVDLVRALQLGDTTSETDAESILVTAGIAPHNGWIADYPVTPDILSELWDSVAAAADSKALNMSRESALAALGQVMDEYELALSGDETEESRPGEEYYETTVIDDYYYDEGPPVVTYYPPPAAYLSLYSWVPYPFWWSDFWFPGYYILYDFNRHVIVGGRPCVVTNHFFDGRLRGYSRVDPVNRFRNFHGVLTSERTRVIGPARVRGENPSPLVRSLENRRAQRNAGSTPSPNRAGSDRLPGSAPSYRDGSIISGTAVRPDVTSRSGQQQIQRTLNAPAQSPSRPPTERTFTAPRSVNAPAAARTFSAPPVSGTPSAPSVRAPSAGTPAMRSFSAPSGGSFGRGGGVAPGRR